MSSDNINLTLNVWRQKSPESKGNFEEFKVTVSPHASVLELLDELNNGLEKEGKDPIAFESDCREGICGTCGLVINGHPHGPLPKTATCQLHMRNFKNGETLYIEPMRAKPFPIIKDLIVDRSGFDKIQQSGAFVSFNTGSAPDANAIPISKDSADASLDAAECIGCGACVAACKNSSAMLFVGAKVSQFALLPQGQPERYDRVQEMVTVMDDLGFGNCTNTYACEAECPKGISVANIARLNREYIVAKFKSNKDVD
ncbi:MAG TPA: succinate dehydrogenase/fumarate reductase iron-sulfur subunit [Ignavibacteriaceae bacterium]|nr:succinate dehydrogenase/fumarate reductase iron-sulfur subunit [Ignavibacteriaceae bacterium]